LRGAEGYTLLEMLLALMLSVTILGAFLGAADCIQRWGLELNQVLERDRNAALAPLLLTRWVYSAGNNRWTGHLPQGCSLESGYLRVRSDLDGPGGFPDGDLDESYEDIAIRQNGSDLQIRSGAGSFQPVAKNFLAFRPDLSPPLARLEVQLQTDQRLPSTGIPGINSFDLSLYLWNYHPNLFPEELQ
jgi:hypothetical protein